VNHVNRGRPEPRPLRSSGATAENREFVRLAARLPDAAPDDLLVERVWRRLQTPDPGPSEVWRWLAASTLALMLIVGGGWWLSAASTRAEVLLTEGGVFVTTSGASWVPARRGDPLAAGTLLRSDASGRTVLRVPGVAALILDKDADLSLERLGRSIELRLVSGSVTLRVTKRTHGHPFVVRAGDFTVTVVGTLFSVKQAPSGRVEVGVNEGAVDVARRGDRWRVEAGHSWNSDVPGEQTRSDIAQSRLAVLAAAITAPPSPDLTELMDELVRSEAPPPVPSLVEASGPALAQPPSVVVIDQPASHERVDRVVPRHTNSAAPALARADPIPPITPGDPAVLGLAPQPTLPTAPARRPPPAPAVAAPPARNYYAEALNLARHGEHQMAAAILERALAAGEGPRDLELYQLALLRQRHLNDPQGALDALQGYRSQFPRGALRQEVDLSVVQVDVALGRAEAALSESARFLAAHPQSERADEVRILRGDLLRQRGDFAAAAGEYRSVSGGAALEDALFYWAYCRLQLGDGSSAVKALQDYLGRFPAGRHAAAVREALSQ
jgi:ferric-dicitrate binding protein FerR (iron transport regulator)